VRKEARSTHVYCSQMQARTQVVTSHPGRPHHHICGTSESNQMLQAPEFEKLDSRASPRQRRNTDTHNHHQFVGPPLSLPQLPNRCGNLWHQGWYDVLLHGGRPVRPRHRHRAGRRQHGHDGQDGRDRRLQRRAGECGGGISSSIN